MFDDIIIERKNAPPSPAGAAISPPSLSKKAADLRPARRRAT
jgi:hypothetical protein